MMMTVEKLINFVEPSAVGDSYRIISKDINVLEKISEFDKSEYKNAHVKKSRWVNENSEWVFVINI
jgi:hypothetical protein